MPHHRQLLARPDSEIHILQDLPLGVVGKINMAKAHLTLSQLQRPGIGPVLDLRLLLHQLEDQVHVGQGVLDLAVDHAEEVERDEQLQQEGVNQHQVTDRHPARHHSVGGKEHDRGDAKTDDRPLA